MPKLIIPNAYELYQMGTSLTQHEINARYFYNLRFLWLLEPGDAILLPKPPAQGFLSYLAEVKQIDLDSVHVVILDDHYASLDSTSLSDDHLIVRLQKIIHSSSEWRILSCYFNQAIAKLADALHIVIDSEWRKSIQSDFIKRLNSKAEFRKISISHHLPIPEGIVCVTKESLAEAIKHLLEMTGQVIVKQEYNASGKGNIGISLNENHRFVGVIKTIMINKNKSINDIANQIWLEHIHVYNKLFIVEVYHPNKGSFTAQFWSPPRGLEPTLQNYSEIRMESSWVGVHIAPQTLSTEQTNKLISYSKQYAYILQQYGYQGYLCCDAILTEDDNILFTEINVRPGAETHAYVLAQQLAQADHESNRVVLTRNGLKTSNFIKMHQQLKEEGLLLKNNTGIAILTVDDIYSKQFEYLIAASDLNEAFELEEKLNQIFYG